MAAWSELVATAEEKAQRYYEGIDLGDESLYDADAPDIPDELTDPEQPTTAGPRDTEGQFSGPRDVEGLFSGPDAREGLFSGRDDMDVSSSGRTDDDSYGLGGGSGRRRVRFSFPRDPRAEGHSDPEGGSLSPRRRSPVRSTGDPQVGKNINTLFNFSRLNCFNTNRVRNRFRAGTVKSLK